MKSLDGPVENYCKENVILRDGAPLGLAFISEAPLMLLSSQDIRHHDQFYTHWDHLYIKSQKFIYG